MTLENQLIACCRNGDIKTLEKGLLSPDANPYKDELLIVAAEEGQIEIIELLIRKGADFQGNTEKCINSAAEYGRDNLTKYLLKMGTKPNISEDRALVISYLRGHEDTFNILLQAYPETAIKNLINIPRLKSAQKIFEIELAKRALHKIDKIRSKEEELEI